MLSVLLLLLLLLLLLSDDDVSRNRRRTMNTQSASFETNSSECRQNRSRRPGHQLQSASHTYKSYQYNSTPPLFTYYYQFKHLTQFFSENRKK